MGLGRPSLGLTELPPGHTLDTLSLELQAVPLGTHHRKFIARKMGIENRFRYWLMIDASCEDCLSSFWIIQDQNHQTQGGLRETQVCHPEWWIGTFSGVEILKYPIYWKSLHKVEPVGRVGGGEQWLVMERVWEYWRFVSGAISINISSISRLMAVEIFW